MESHRILHAQSTHDGMHAFFGDALAQKRTQHGRMSDIEMHGLDAEFFERTHGQRHDFGIGFNAARTEELNTRHHGFAACEGMHRTCVQAAAGVAQAAHTFASENMRIDAGALRRHVGSDADRAARARIHEFERAVVEVAAASRQKRVDVFDHRRLHEFKPVHLEQIEATAAHQFEHARLARQNIRKVFRNKPTGHIDHFQ